MQRYNNSHHHSHHRRRTRSSGESHDNGDYLKVVNGNAIFRNKDHWSKVSSSFTRFRDNNKFCDVKLKVCETVYDAHKVILSSVSNYFEAMFTNDLIERDQNYVVIHDISEKIFRQIFDYIYNGEITINEENVQEMLASANMFQLNEIVNFCCKFLLKQLHPSNCIGIYRFAEFHSCTMLRLEAKRFIERHFAEVMVEEEFYDIPKDTLKNFLRSEGLSIDSEFQVLGATMQWILKDVTDKRQYFAELMDCVRIPVIPIKQLENFVNVCPDADLKEELYKLLQNHKEAIDEFEMNKKQNLFAKSNFTQSNGYSDVRWQPRMCARKSVYVIGGINQWGHRWNDCRSLASAERLDVLRGQWKSLPPLKNSRNCHGTAVLNGLIFIAGGEHDSLLFDSVEIYDPHDNEWRKGPSLKQPRSCFGMCQLDSYIYALGGCIGKLVGNSIERYDPNVNEWHFYDKLLDVRFAMGMVSYENIIYIIGGFDEHNSILKTVQSYNPVTRQFQKLSDLIHPRAFFGCSVLHGHIYVAGGTSDGTNALRTVERYNISENYWAPVKDIITARIAPCAASVNDCLLIIGGKVPGDEFTMPSTLDSVEIYDPESNKWSESIPIPTGRCEATVVVI